MSQQSVLDFLKENKNYFSSKEISKKLNLSVGSTDVSLKKLFLSDDVIKKKVVDGLKRYYVYKYKR